MAQVAEPSGSTSIALPVVGHWIGGAPVAGASGRRGPIYDPATGAQTKWVDFASTVEVDAAVAAAEAAFPAWRALSMSRRTDILFRIRNLVEQHRKELAGYLTAEHGKVPSDALGEIARGLENLEFACGVPHLIKGGFTEQASTGVDVYQLRQPLGVVAGITPFNFPAMVPMWMFANALACGNAFILKPSEKVPLTAVKLGELITAAGFPPGLFSIVHGGRAAVEALIDHQDVSVVGFVGSTAVARAVYTRTTGLGKRALALGGAKNPVIVVPDADPAVTVPGVVSSFMITRCSVLGEGAACIWMCV